MRISVYKKIYFDIFICIKILVLDNVKYFNSYAIPAFIKKLLGNLLSFFVVRNYVYYYINVEMWIKRIYKNIVAVDLNELWRT